MDKNARGQRTDRLRQEAHAVSLHLTRNENMEIENALVSVKLEEERTLQGADPNDTEFRAQLQQHLAALDVLLEKVRKV
jgi:hypothetical protein